jgi:carbon storage regulator
MLVLSRRVGEEIVIGEGAMVRVVVLDVRDGKTRLGIAAPREVPVHRGEVHAEIQAERHTRARRANLAE